MTANTSDNGQPVDIFEELVAMIERDSAEAAERLAAARAANPVTKVMDSAAELQKSSKEEESHRLFEIYFEENLESLKKYDSPDPDPSEMDEVDEYPEERTGRRAAALTSRVFAGLSFVFLTSGLAAHYYPGETKAAFDRAAHWVSRLSPAAPPAPVAEPPALLPGFRR